MIIGTGIDIIEIDRIKRILNKYPGFLKRIFAREEIKYFNNRKMSIATVAGGFAAKEAVVKALGTGVRQFGWKEVRILRDELGKPVVIIKGKAKLVTQNAGIREVLVSISHSRRYAVAQAIAVGGVKDEDCYIGPDETNR